MPSRIRQLSGIDVTAAGDRFEQELDAQFVLEIVLVEQGISQEVEIAPLACSTPIDNSLLALRAGVLTGRGAVVALRHTTSKPGGHARGW